MMVLPENYRRQAATSLQHSLRHSQFKSPHVSLISDLKHGSAPRAVCIARIRATSDPISAVCETPDVIAFLARLL
ncbi:MAG: hypothetical protein WD709_00410 [Gammaproteobacteria bacterium]